MNSTLPLKNLVFAALFSALIAAGAFVSIPIGPVPIVLQNLFVLLAGVILGPLWGVGAVAVYLFIGLLGFPVFAGGTGGMARLLGPTGGYLLGYIPAVFITGHISHHLKQSFKGDLTALAAGSILVYMAGVPWLKFYTGMAWGKSLALGMLPFLIGDGLKVVAGAYIAKTIRPVIRR